MLYRYYSSITFFILLLTLLPSSIRASTEYQLSHQTIAPTIDGVIDEPQWQQATTMSLDYDDVPGKGAPAPVKTIAYLYEDGKSLHVALHAFTPNPEQIRAHLSDRDQARADDLLGIVIDTFNDERNGYEFFVNPLGVQIDARMTDKRGWKTNDSWNASWQSAATMTPDGWRAELSIPLSILRFANTKEQQTWGIAVYRSHQGKSQRWLTNFKRDNKQNCNLCQFSKITGFRNVKQSNNLQVIPGVTYSQKRHRLNSSEAWVEEKELAASVNISWAPNENSTLNATINPDFSQVEADTAQLDINSPHALSVAEKRTFFLEGTEYLTTDLLNLVHTRSIVAPEYGLKYSGKSGSQSYGVLIANDQETRFVLPNNQSSSITELSTSSPSDLLIARYNQDLGEKTSIGALYTQRSNTKYRNSLISIDGKLALTGSDLLHFQWAHSDSKNPFDIQSAHDLTQNQKGNALSLNYNRDLYRYTLGAAYENIGQGFRADLGFITEADYIRKKLNGSLKFYGENNSWFKRGSTSANYHHKADRQGQLLSEKMSLSANMEGIYHASATLTLDDETRLFKDRFDDSETYFKLNQIHLDSKFQPISSVKLNFIATRGDAIDYQNGQLGAFKRFKSEANLYLGQRLNIKFSHEYRSIDSDKTQHVIDGQLQQFDAGNIFQAKQNDLRISYQFNTKAQLKLISQYTHIKRNTELHRANRDNNPSNDIAALTRNINNQIVFSYKLNADSLFYLGYSDQGAHNPELGHLETRERRIFSKFSYAWRN
ncbi:carbohydrate binding family 9 domain-containing protein [Catenovulum maritimum]|uniref:DUF5916 domain-containing protein n=1 Tax=Catenovulum maritimum TaxID=1513271 RepID=A0A0J8GS66_9ALTE|nr:carbohydrate binding family 9 domain-containing protein [Catenovulum maritimum]KMT64144.1 hypothetical protein XM47_15840 [Catenovulum maritimum]